MRIPLLASVGAVALGSVSFAADLPVKAPPPPPLYSWTGVYAGINAGGHWSNSTMYIGSADSDGLDVGGGLGAAQISGVIPTTGDNHFSGFIGGGQFGYNYQLNNFVLGLEADFDGTTGRGGSSALLANDVFIFPTQTQTAQRLDWFGTLRGRLGWTPVDRLLIYATGGLAFGQSTASLSVFNIAALPVLDSYVSSKKNTGWTVGGGLEYALPDIWSNWSVKIEYLYYDLGYTTSSIYYQNIDLNGANEFSSLSGKVRHNGNIVRAGLNYKVDFGAPPPAIVTK